MTMTNFDEVYLRRASKIQFDISNPTVDTLAYVATFNKNLESLGYTLSGDALSALLQTDDRTVVRTANDVVRNLKVMLGDHVTHRPMYPNFPIQVMEAPNAVLYINALVHYFGSSIGMNILPVYEKDDRPALTHTQPLKVIDRGSIKDSIELMTNLIQSKVSFSQTDKEDVKTYINSDAFFPSSVKYDIPNKENLATVVKLGLEAGRLLVAEDSFKTATDVLRLAVAMSDGDVSLAEKTTFRKFKKAERRMLLAMLNNAGNIEEDMLRYASQWKRLGEILHPGEYSNRYPVAFVAFSKIRNNEHIATFNSRVEQAIGSGAYLEAAKVLSARPGEFARRLDVLLRNTDKVLGAAVLDQFEAVAQEVSPSVLLQLRSSLRGRVFNKNRLRTFYPKGNLAKVQVIPETRPALESEVMVRAYNATSTALIRQFGQREPLGKVWIDPSLKDYSIPFGVRSASKAVKTAGRGSKLPLPEANTVRFFVHWKNIEGDGYDDRVDIDMSLGLMNSEFESSGTVAYYNLRELGAHHSGDITNAPNGASEFIDLDVDKALKAGHRYAYMVIHSYSHQSFAEIPELFAGFMGRTAPASGEIFEPKTVQDKMDITSDAQQGMVYIVDLQERVMIWVDTILPSAARQANNLANNRSRLSLLAEALVTGARPKLGDLFQLHATARGTLVETREEAEFVIADGGDLSPFDTEKILADFL